MLQRSLRSRVMCGVMSRLTSRMTSRMTLCLAALTMGLSAGRGVAGTDLGKWDADLGDGHHA